MLTKWQNETNKQKNYINKQRNGMSWLTVDAQAHAPVHIGTIILALREWTTGHLWKAKL